MFQNTHWKHKMKCIQIKNEVKTINTMRHQTIDKWKGTAAAAGPPGPGGPSPAAAAAPFHLYMVWCLIVLIVFTSFSICIHFILCFQCVFDLYFLLYFPYFYFLCFFLYFLFIHIYNLYINESPRNGKKNKSLRNHHQNTNERVRRRRVPPARGSQPWAAAAAPFHLYMVWCLIVLIVFGNFKRNFKGKFER